MKIKSFHNLDYRNADAAQSSQRERGQRGSGLRRRRNAASAAGSATSAATHAEPVESWAAVGSKHDVCAGNNLRSLTKRVG